MVRVSRELCIALKRKLSKEKQGFLYVDIVITFLLCDRCDFFVVGYIPLSSVLSVALPGGGISSYAGQQGAAGRSLEACLDQAVEDVPKERHRLTPVYLGATAGMRLLQ